MIFNAKYAFLLLVFLLTSFHLSAQYDAIDSLIHRFQENPNETIVQADIKNDIRIILFEDPEFATQKLQQIIDIAEQNQQHEMLATMIMNLGISWDLRGKYDLAIIQFDKALELAKTHKLQMLQGDIYNNCGIVYAYKGELEKSLDHSLKALDIYQSLSDSGRLARIYNNLGSRYSEMEMHETALDYYRKAMIINTETGDEYRLAQNYGNIGTIYSELDQNVKALEYYLKAFEIQEKRGNLRGLSITLGNMAIAYQNLGEYERSLEYSLRSYEISKQTNDELGILSYFMTCANTYMQQNKFDQSLNCFLEAEQIAQKLGTRHNLMEIYKSMSELFAKQKQFEKAYQYKEKYLDERAFLLDSEKGKALEMLKHYENMKKENEIALLTKDAKIQKLELRRQKILRNSFIGAGILLLLILILLGHRYFYVRRMKNRLASQNKIIENEKQKSDSLLLNILPEETAEELKETGSSKARRFDVVTVMFTDFRNFTKIGEELRPEELVSEVDHCFKAFDQIISKYPIEKIKTIGDAYMCAGGLPVPNSTNPEDVVNAGLDMIDFMESYSKQQEEKGLIGFEIRVGIHTGPVVAGIVGTKKFAYDIWGDTVNIASRMESSGESGYVNISEITYGFVKNQFNCRHRGKIQAKNKGSVDMYFVERKDSN
ncbi:MAG: tetratricopeptide repeat protein [Bacteroidales bacterium]|nr:tetratricopeptide repeat protein [Bacteroidales bacterium]MCF8343495.1 tetratricopeptide repeat protein [Bacteroidales bacterium]MCF8349748.1 tetratricopeptide repeat protein [Bacteroidales bacterium]MCF8376267.1 tetratricopeptide repeat protein [Bacteroidales bacterium]